MIGRRLPAKKSEPTDDPPDAAIAAKLDALRRLLEGDRPTNIRSPITLDFAYRPLDPFFGKLMNNVGDPYLSSALAANCKDMEREVVEWVADLFRAPVDD